MNASVNIDVITCKIQFPKIFQKYEKLLNPNQMPSVRNCNKFIRQEHEFNKGIKKLSLHQTLLPNSQKPVYSRSLCEIKGNSQMRAEGDFLKSSADWSDSRPKIFYPPGGLHLSKG